MTPKILLSRVLMLKPSSRTLFKIAVGVFSIGLLLSLVSLDLGLRVSGLGLIMLGAWLLRFDIARHTIKKTGLTRYIAACLLPGYVWLIIGGGLWLAAGLPSSTLTIDAMLHALFLGFVFSMIFGHAPIILPALLPVDITFRSIFYAPLMMLQTSLAVRVVADLWLNFTLRQWAGLFNVLAILLFLGVRPIASSTVSPLPLSELLRKCDWPGNVRQLQNEVQRAVLLCEGDEVDATDLSITKVRIVGEESQDTNFTLLEGVERNAIVQMLKETGGNKLETAKRLGIGRQTLYNKIKAYAIET